MNVMSSCKPPGPIGVILGEQGAAVRVSGLLDSFSGIGKKEATQNLGLGADQRIHGAEPAFPDSPAVTSLQAPLRHQHPADPSFSRIRTLREGHASLSTGHTTRQTRSLSLLPQVSFLIPWGES